MRCRLLKLLWKNIQNAKEFYILQEQHWQIICNLKHKHPYLMTLQMMTLCYHKTTSTSDAHYSNADVKTLYKKED